MGWLDPNPKDPDPDSTNRKGANPVDPVDLDPAPILPIEHALNVYVFCTCHVCVRAYVCACVCACVCVCVYVCAYACVCLNY